MKYSIDQIKEMLGKISHWPWRANGEDGVYDKHGESIIFNTDYDATGVYERYGCQIKPPPNHTLIVNAPTIISYLLDQLEEARKALEFYADSYTWVSNSGKVGVNPIDHDTENMPGTQGARRFCGGKLARQALDRMK